MRRYSSWICMLFWICLTPLRAQEVLLARMGVLVSGDDPQVVSSVFGEERWIDELLAWDPETDRPELEQLLGVAISGELLRQAVDLPLEGGELLAGVDYEGSWYEIGVSVRPFEGDGYVSSARILRDGELISAPRIVNELGKRAIVTTADAAGFFFFVLELDRIDEGEARERENWGWEGLEKVDQDRVKAPQVHPDRRIPKYSEEAREARLQGKVVLRTVIDTAGRIERIHVMRGLPLGLSEAAVEAVRSWRFDPATRDGEPVAVVYVLTVRFRLEKDKKPEKTEIATPEGEGQEETSS